MCLVLVPGAVCRGTGVSSTRQASYWTFRWLVEMLVAAVVGQVCEWVRESLGSWHGMGDASSSGMMTLLVLGGAYCC